MHSPTSLRRRLACTALAGGTILVSAGCGTLLPKRDFAAQGTVLRVDPATGATEGAGATLPGADPAASAADASGDTLPAPLTSAGPAATLPGAAPGPATLPGAGPGTLPAPGSTGSTGHVGATNAPGAGKPTASAAPGTKTSSAPTAGKSAAAGNGSAAANTASDVGVTPTTITVCNIVTSGGPFGTAQFTPGYYGAQAFFADLNAHGGVDGRTVNFVSHPDDGSPSGNTTQVHTCIDTEKAFAFVANNIYQYGGVSYEDQMDIPDIGGQEISTAYAYYPHLYAMGGIYVPRNHMLGFGGKIYNTSEQALFFKQKLGVQHVGIVYYDQASSQTGSEEIGDAFKAAGVDVTAYQVNLGLPNFSSAVSQMQADGVDTVADALDQNGNQKLCGAIDQNSSFASQMKVKLSTIANWTQSFGSQFANSPSCLAKTYIDGSSWNYADPAGNPEVAKFNNDIKQYFPAQAGQETQWMLEGYAAADMFTEAASSCGAKLTRACVEVFMNRQQPITDDGLMNPLTSYYVRQPSYYSQPTNQCVSVVQWSTTAKTWVNRGTFDKDCYSAPGYSYDAPQPS